MYSYFHQLYLFSWRDMVEIAIFALGVFAISRWLASSKSRHLLVYAYLLFGCFALASVLELNTLTTFFILCWPGLLILLFVMRLQRSPEFPQPKTIIPAKTSEKEWIPLLMRAMYKGLQYKKDLTFIIEGTHTLAPLLNKPIEVQSNLQHGLLDIMIESPAINLDGLVWIHHTGTLIAFNCTWQREIDPAWLATYHDQYERWQQDALFWTSKTDALVVRANQDTRLISIIAQGTHAPELTNEHAQTVIAQYVRKYRYTPSTKGDQPCVSA